VDQAPLGGIAMDPFRRRRDFSALPCQISFTRSSKRSLASLIRTSSRLSLWELDNFDAGIIKIANECNSDTSRFCTIRWCANDRSARFRYATCQAFNVSGLENEARASFSFHGIRSRLDEIDADAAREVNHRLARGELRACRRAKCRSIKLFAARQVGCPDPDCKDLRQVSWVRRMGG
jgi:hypothetical protein